MKNHKKIRLIWMLLVLMTLNVGCKINNDKNDKSRIELLKESDPLKLPKPNSSTKLDEHILNVVVRFDSVFIQNTEHISFTNFEQYMLEFKQKEPKVVIYLNHDKESAKETIIQLMELSFKQNIQMILTDTDKHAKKY